MAARPNDTSAIALHVKPVLSFFGTIDRQLRSWWKMVVVAPRT